MVDITFPQWDKDLFVYLNNKHISWLDPIMYAISTYTFWGLTCLAIIIYILYINRYKRYAGLRVVSFLLLGLVMNSVTNNLIKLIIKRPRPGSDPTISDAIRQLEDIGSTSSFFSAHSSNSICLALFSALYFRNKYYGIVAFAWAMAVAYSRIYVGKHYPLDIICGIMFGFITGWFSYWLYKRYCEKKGIPTN